MVAFYTPDYEPEYHMLVDSVKGFNIEFYGEKVDLPGRWEERVNHKPIFIKRMLEKFGTDIVYIDADATIEKDPELFDRLDCDVAFWLCKRVNSEISAGGTLFFSKESMWFVDEWIKDCEETKDNEQDCLWRVINRTNVKKELLPIEYCQIFDYPKQSENPVIVHHQASRTHRR